MPDRVRVIAEKEGFESSSIWISNARDFQEADGVMRREVHMVLPPLRASNTPGAQTTSDDAPEHGKDGEDGEDGEDDTPAPTATVEP